VTTLIEARGMAAGYAGLPALRDVDFTIRKGEIVTVVGPNGSGKSTLVKTLIGLLSPTAGQVRRAEGLTIGYVPQRLAIDTTLPMTVARFLSLPVRRGRADMAEMLRRVGVPGLEGRQMTRLSGGQFQRVLLARALLGAARPPDPRRADAGARPAWCGRVLPADRGGAARDRLRDPAGEPRPSCGDERVRPGDLPQRPCLLRGDAGPRAVGTGIPRALRRGGGRCARALPPPPRPFA
jgi:hypothetical protein